MEEYSTIKRNEVNTHNNTDNHKKPNFLATNCIMPLIGTSGKDKKYRGRN